MGAEQETSGRDRELRYGVIGTGLMGCEHLRNLVALPGSRVVAVADPEERSRRWARSALEGAPAAVEHDRVEALLERDDLDVVVIASPNMTHLEVASGVLRRRPDLHVLVEKPLCTTVEACRALIAVRDARPTGSGLVSVGLEYRHLAPVSRLVQEVRSGAIGTLRMIAIREHRFPFLVKVGDWNRFTANTGGTLVEKCCHFFDLMHLVTGERPWRVYASGGQDVNHLDEIYETPDGPRRSDILDNAYVIVDFPSGARGMLDLCMFAEGGPNEQELVATGDLAKVEAFLPSAEMRVGIRGGAPRENGEGTAREIRRFVATHDGVAHVGLHHGASYLEHVALREAILQGSHAPVSLEEGLWSVAVGEAAHRSIAEGRPVLLSELGLP